MKCYHLTENDYRTSDWSGGKTTQLAIFPQDSQYLERDFLWRISSATVDTEESDFSKLPDYDRVLMVLKGEVILNYQGQRTVKLKELEQDSFDGGWKTVSYGKITDFNLMVRKGSEGHLDIIRPESDRCDYRGTFETSKTFTTHTLYCKEGYALVSTRNFCDGKSPNDGIEEMVKPGELLVLEFSPEEEVRYSVIGEGTLIRAQIFFDDEEGRFQREVIPEEKGTFDDFKQCVFLANTQFRGSQRIFKKLKEVWYDEKLQNAIDRIEGKYITFIGFTVGLFAILMLSAVGTIGNKGIILLILGWFLAECLLVSPLIYYFFVPKPVRKHIKKVEDLTPYERRVRMERMDRNERLEKVMKRYKNSGRNGGTPQ